MICIFFSVIPLWSTTFYYFLAAIWLSLLCPLFLPLVSHYIFFFFFFLSSTKNFQLLLEFSHKSIQSKTNRELLNIGVLGIARIKAWCFVVYKCGQNGCCKRSLFSMPRCWLATTEFETHLQFLN